MASEFLKQYAKSSREKIDREYGKKAYGGSKYKMDKVWGQTATQETAAKQKPVTEPISEPVPQKKKENISFWEKLLNAFGDAGYSADTTTPLALTNQAISDDYRESNMQESKTAETGGNIAKSAVKSAESAYENAAGTFLNKRSGTQMMGVTVADNAVPQEDKDKAEAARKRNQESIYAKADKAAAAAAEASEKAKDNLGGSKAAGAFVDIASGGLQLGADMALNALLPGAGLANMGLRSYGSGSREARLDGASEGEQVAYGAAAAAVDVLTEKIFDVGKLFGGGAADDVAEKLVGKLAKTDAGRSVVRALTNAVGEGAEEAVADILNPAIRAIYDKGAAAKSSYTTAEGAKERLNLYLSRVPDGCQTVARWFPSAKKPLLRGFSGFERHCKALGECAKLRLLEVGHVLHGSHELLEHFLFGFRQHGITSFPLRNSSFCGNVVVKIA